MSFIDSDIIHNNQSIKNTIISYEREKSICTGTSQLTLTVEWKTDRTFTAWDEIILYEEGNKIGVFLIVDTAKNHTGDRVITCQDYSKKLSDYFVPQIIEIPDFAYTRTWIIYFLNLVGVDYTFTTSSSGSYINNNTVFGRQMAFDIIQSLLQMSGWYMYFDNDGTCIIGELSKDLSNPDFIFDDTEIQKLQVNKSDKSLRNRAVVWGLVSPEEKKSVYADITVTTPWDTSPKDQRAVVLSNAFVRSSATAKSLARKMLDNFAELTIEKTVTLVRNYNLDVGQIVQLESDYFSGIGLVSTVMSTMSADGGLISTIILDQKCPRLFGYFGYVVPVYVGTEGAGIWRKPLDSGLWENFSYGLFNNPADPSIPGVDLNEVNPTEGVVPDLIIKNSIFACVNGVWAYRNLGHNKADWKPLDCGTLTDLNGISYTQASVQAMAVDIDSTNNNIFVGYKLRDTSVQVVGENRSWVVEFTSKGVRLAVNLLSFGKDKQNFELVDVDKYKSSVDLAVAIAPTSYDNFWGNRKVSNFTSSEVVPDQETTCFGLMPTPGFALGDTPIVQSGTSGGTMFGGGDYYGVNDLLVEGNTISSFGDENAFQYVAYSGNTKYYLASLVDFPVIFNWSYNTHLFRYLYREEKEDNYNIVDIYRDGTSESVRKFLHTSYTPLLYEYPTDLGICNVATVGEVTLSGIQNIDGITLVAGNTVLVKDQDNPAENGVYTVQSALWNRSLILDADSDVKPGMFASIVTGTENEKTCWQTDESTTGALGQTPLIFYPVLVPKEEHAEDVTNEAVAGFTNRTTWSDYLGSRGGVFFLDYYKRTTIYGSKTELSVFSYDLEGKSLIKTPVASTQQTTVQPYGENVAPLYGIQAWNETFRLTVCDDGVGMIYLFNDFREANPYIMTGDPTVTNFFPENIKVEIVGVVIEKDGTFVEHRQKIWDWWLPCHNNKYGMSVLYDWYINYLVINSYYSELYGFDTSKTVTPTFRVKLRIDSAIWSSGCGVCPRYGSNSEDVVYGTVKLNKDEMVVDMPFSPMSGKSRGYVCYSCSAFDFDTLAWEAFNFQFYHNSNNPLQSKLGLPKCVRKGKVQEYPFDDSATGLTIPVPASSISPIMDDIDNGIYVVDLTAKKVYKTTSANLRPFGDPAQIDTLATFDISQYITGTIFPWSNSFNFFNGTFFLGGFAKYAITDYLTIKINDEVILPGMKICLLLKRKDTDLFTTLDSNFFEFHTENSKDSPLSSFTTDRFLLSGYPLFLEEIAPGVTNDAGSFRQNVKIYSTLTKPSIIYSGVSDTRIVDLGGTFYTDAGSVDLDYARYMMTAGTDQDMRFVNTGAITDLESFHTVASGIVTSGTAYRLETTNKYLSPYTFVTTSGIFLEGIQSNFYQRNPNTSGWIDYSIGLPLQNCLCVRVDDLL